LTRILSSLDVDEDLEDKNVWGLGGAKTSVRPDSSQGESQYCRDLGLEPSSGREIKLKSPNTKSRVGSKGIEVQKVGLSKWGP